MNMNAGSLLAVCLTGSQNQMELRGHFVRGDPLHMNESFSGL